MSRDPRQMTDWLSAGKFSLCIRCNAGSEVGKAVQQKLPIAYLDTEELERGRQLQRGRRHAGAADARAASERGKNIYQLAALTRRPIGAAEIRPS